MHDAATAEPTGKHFLPAKSEDAISCEPTSRHRHRKPPSTGRYHAISLRLSSDELQRLHAVARETGESCSNFLRLGIAIGRRLQEVHAEVRGYHLQRIVTVLRQLAVTEAN